MSYDVRDPRPGRSYSIYRMQLDGRDVTNNLLEFQAWEGLDSGLCEGMLQLVSNQRAFADLDPSQEMDVHVEFSEEQDRSLGSLVNRRPRRWSRKFKTISFDRYLIDSTVQQEVIQLSLANPAVLESTRLRMSVAFNDMYYHEIVENILGQIGISRPDVQKTFRKQHIVLPNVHPLDAVDWCSSGAIDSRGGVGRWRLWEDNTGVHWRDTVAHISSSETWRYDIGQDQDRENDNADHLPETAWTPGIALDKYDWNTSMQGGSDNLTWNFTTREMLAEEVSIDDVLGRRRRINSKLINDDRGANTLFSWSESPRSAKSGSGRHIGAEGPHGFAQATVELPGRVAIIPGDKIKIKHRDPGGDIIEHNSGTWAIRTIRHRVSREEFTQILGLYRLSR